MPFACWTSCRQRSSAAICSPHRAGVTPIHVPVSSTVPNGKQPDPSSGARFGLSVKPEPTLGALANELDSTYRAVAAGLLNDRAARFETVAGKPELVLSTSDKMDGAALLTELGEAVTRMLPRVDLPELILEIAVRTGFTDAFSHLSERTARAADLHVSLRAVLVAEACVTGMEPLIRNDVSALKRDRLPWVDQSYLRGDTLTSAHAVPVSALSRLDVARL